MTKEEMTEIAHMMFKLVTPLVEEQIERASGEVPYRVERYLELQLGNEIHVLVAKAVREQVDVRITVKQAASGPVGTDIASDQSGGK